MANSLMELLMNMPSAEERFGQIQSLLGTGGFGSGFSAPPTVDPNPIATGNSSHWEDVARKRARNQYGWTGEDWRAIDSIIERESSWNPNAVNPSSGAYGIPQINPSAHPDANLQGDPIGQIKWLLSYIRQRYGSPTAALAYKNANNSY